MLIVADPKLLLVDEPAAGLDRQGNRTDRRAAAMELKGHHTIIVIEHDMDFVRRLDSRVTVLNEGRCWPTERWTKCRRIQQVIEAYLGR